jgi:hypothetical protein
LLNDEDLMVRLEAIDALIDILSTFLTPEQVDRDVLPSIIKHLLIDHDEECTQRMSSLFGKLLFNLPLEK